MTELEKNALKKSYNNFKYELSEEDDEDGRYDLAAKFETEVGISGRFNRPNANETNIIGINEGKDEYEDTKDLIKEVFK